MTSAPGTSWTATVSEGLDAVAFLGALSGVALYRNEYPSEAIEFSRRLGPQVVQRIADLTADASASGFGLMWPNLVNVLSVAEVSTIEDVTESLADLEGRVLPYRSKLDWEMSDWAWFLANAPALHDVMSSLRDAGFSDYRAQLTGSALAQRSVALERELAPFDVVGLVRRLSGKHLDSTVEIVLLHFCRPHGVRITGQRFIQSADFDLMTTVRVAAHELLHPPIDMNGSVATQVIERLRRDELLTRIVRDHDPSWGYTTLEGYLNEDICQAIDQLIIEQLSVARNPADRWHTADGGMHVLAAALYGMLREDRWVARGGGSIEEWLGSASRSGRLEPVALHALAARVLERPVEALWPPPAHDIG